MPSGSNPLSEPMLTELYVAIWRHQAIIGEYIDTETNGQFCKIYFKTNFIEWQLLYFDLDFKEIGYQGTNY